MERMSQGRMVKGVYEGEVSGMRGRGRQKLKWRGFMRERGLVRRFESERVKIKLREDVSVVVIPWRGGGIKGLID